MYLLGVAIVKVDMWTCQMFVIPVFHHAKIVTLIKAIVQIVLTLIWTDILEHANANQII